MIISREDLNIVDLAGTLTWTPPVNVSDEVITYAVYVAQSASGLNKQLLSWNQSGFESAPGASYINLGEVPYGVNSFEVPLGTLRSSFSHFVVFSRSAPRH